MENMTAFEKWNVWLLIFQTTLLFLTLLAACWIGKKQIRIGQKQNEINDRLRKLSDYVAVFVVPEVTRIKLMNTGRANLYLCGFDLPGNKKMLDRPRLLPAGTGNEAYYWIDPPSGESVRPGQQFDFIFYLKDEFGQKWVSRHGASVAEEVTDVEIDGKKAKSGQMTIWTYKTEREEWKATADV